MAAACKALPRCTRAYSAVIDRQATLSYECVDSRNRAAVCMHTSHALVKLFIGRQCHLSTIGAQNSWYAIPSRTPGDGFCTSTSYFELRARCSAPTKARTAALPPQLINRKG